MTLVRIVAIESSLTFNKMWLRVALSDFDYSFSEKVVWVDDIEGTRELDGDLVHEWVFAVIGRGI